VGHGYKVKHGGADGRDADGYGCKAFHWKRSFHIVAYWVVPEFKNSIAFFYYSRNNVIGYGNFIKRFGALRLGVCQHAKKQAGQQNNCRLACLKKLYY
jgi:hypothetical protein